MREKKKERKRKRNGYRTNQKKAETKEWKRAETETRNMIIKQENKICKSKKERNLVTNNEIKSIIEKKNTQNLF